MELPREFLERMQDMLGEEYDEFLKTYEKPRNFGLRINRLKAGAQDVLPFHLRQIPWTDNGFYYEKDDAPARHPFYHAGLYYLQEPSAMTPAQLLPVEPGDYVLDLCAAPGGKATELAAKLQGEGLLVANEISASRARALLKNLEVFGVKNSFVTNAVPAKLAGQFEEYFDKILVDAPCSGEGMFRKDIANAKAWSIDKVEDCARIQRDITRCAVKMLRPGGLMLYSTCTFSAEENEGTAAYLLSTCPEMELVDILPQDGFSCGKPELLDGLRKKLGTEFVQKNTEQDAFLPLQTGQVSETAQELWKAGVFGSGETERQRLEKLAGCVRIFPHHIDGEGHFIALFRKKGKLPGFHQKAGRKGGRPTREDEKVLHEFMKDVSMDWSIEQTEVYGGQAYFIPSPPDIHGKIPFLRNGLYLGEIKKGRFEPSQSLAMALKGCAPDWDLVRQGGSMCRQRQNQTETVTAKTSESEHPGAAAHAEYVSVLNFDWRDGRVHRYLCGETIEAEDKHPAHKKGWQLVCVNGYPLGWGKLVNGTLKNKYHPGWRSS